MQREEIQKIFDQQAPSYDQQWAKIAPIRDALQFLAGTVLSDLPLEARILSVGGGFNSRLHWIPKAGQQALVV